jgi:DNA-binding beta-propeller fold protein YncE
VNCPEGLAVSPTGDKLYAASQCGAGDDPLFIIDTNSNKKIDEVPGLAVGNDVITSKDGKKAYVTRANFNWYDRRRGKVGAPLSIIDTETRRVLKTLILQVSANGLTLTPDGRYVLVTNGYQLSVVDTKMTN